MELLAAERIAVVTDVLDPERDRLLDLLSSLDETAWEQPTECPVYTVKGIATHILGDDLSLLSRQRDGAVNGLVLVAEKKPGVDFRSLLNAFNDQWVEAARFLSPPLLIELLRLSGQWSSDYYRQVDPASAGEPVPLFPPSASGTSPFWQAIAREYLERWAHHSQIRRALSMPSLADAPFLDVGMQIIATAAGAPATAPSTPDGDWTLGPLTLGPTPQTADLLTLAHTSAEAEALIEGPADQVAQLAARVGRRIEE